jgi:hypothetical protein
MRNTGHEAKAPVKRRRWGNQAEAAMEWTRERSRAGSEGGSKTLARTFARPFPGD